MSVDQVRANLYLNSSEVIQLTIKIKFESELSCSRAQCIQIEHLNAQIQKVSIWKKNFKN